MLDHPVTCNDCLTSESRSQTQVSGAPTATIVAKDSHSGQAVRLDDFHHLSMELVDDDCR